MVGLFPHPTETEVSEGRRGAPGFWPGESRRGMCTFLESHSPHSVETGGTYLDPPPSSDRMTLLASGLGDKLESPAPSREESSPVCKVL